MKKKVKYFITHLYITFVVSVTQYMLLIEFDLYESFLCISLEQQIKCFFKMTILLYVDKIS